MKRRRLSRGRSKRMFRKSASRSHKKNRRMSMRGGYRL